MGDSDWGRRKLRKMAEKIMPGLRQRIVNKDHPQAVRFFDHMMPESKKTDAPSSTVTDWKKKVSDYKEVEKLAELSHVQWAGWLRYMLENFTADNLAK